ncbi:MAG: S8 family serine peptidase [Candidatus Saccharimonadales bacterium]
MIYRKRPIKRSSTFIAALVLLGMIGGGVNQLNIALASPAASAPVSFNAKTATEGSVVIRTDNVAAIAAAASEQALDVLNVTNLPGDESLVTIEGSPANTGVQLMQLRSMNSIKAKPQINHRYKVTAIPNDTNYSDQWNLTKIGASQAWDISEGSSDTTIAVIDTGVLFEQSWEDSLDCPPSEPCAQQDMPSADKQWTNAGEIGMTAPEDPCWDEIAGAEDKRFNECDDDDNGYIDDWRGWDFMAGWRGDSAVCPNFNDPDTYNHTSEDGFVAEDSDPQPYSCDDPANPTLLNMNHYNGGCGFDVGACYITHGTAVASVAAAATNNSELIAGVDHYAKIMSLRVLDGYGFGDSPRITAAVEYATAMGADVINLSLAVFDDQDRCTSTDTLLEAALLEAKEAGIVVVAAAGNSGTSGVCYPAKSAHTIAVGATNSSDQRASFSSYGPELDVMAPGVNIPAAIPPAKASNYNDYTATASGTSLAAPHVTGLVSLMKSIDSGVSHNEVLSSLRTPAIKVGGMNSQNRTDQYGYGRIYAYGTVKFTELSHPDGTMVKSPHNKTVYLIDDGERRPVSAPIILDSHKRSLAEVKPATPADMNLPLAPNWSFREGTLIKDSTKTIYLIDIESGTPRTRAFQNWSAFIGLGYNLGEVYNIQDRLRPNSSGPRIKDSSIHIDGTLIKSPFNKTVFYLEDGQRLPLSAPIILYSHLRDFTEVKPATPGDMQLPEGPLLGFREGVIVQGGSSSVYIIERQGNEVYKRPFSSAYIRRLLGYKDSEIISTQDRLLPPLDGSAIE